MEARLSKPHPRQTPYISTEKRSQSLRIVFRPVELIRLLDQTGGYQSRAALQPGMNPATLNSKIKTYNINLRALG